MRAKILDGLNYLSKLTPLRVWNALIVLLSYFISKYTKKTYHWGLPISVSFEPTTSCNLRCPECPSGLRSFTRPTGMLQAELYQKVLDEIAPRLTYLIFYFQGEPYLHKQFLELVQYASKKGIYSATSTNGHYLNETNCRKTIESGLDRLIISIDGTTQDVYQQYRIGGKLDKVIEGTKNMVAMKKTMQSSKPHIIFQFLVVQPNEHQIDDVYNLAKELGVDEVRLKTAQVYEYEKGNDLIPTKDKYSRYYKKSDGTWGIKNELLNHCWKLWQGCVITWDGLVVPCCFDKDAEHRMGDLKTDNFKHIWRAKPYQNFRASVLKARSEVEMCKNCTEGTKVWA